MHKEPLGCSVLLCATRRVLDRCAARWFTRRRGMRSALHFRLRANVGVDPIAEAGEASCSNSGPTTG
jgi:hypothetical protein